MSSASGASRRRDHAVDVLIPVYNAEATIAEALRSIQAQTLSAIRLIVVDDGSNDGTPAILEAMARADDRILVVTTINGGIVDALNVGLAHCTAAFVARHDADDLAFPDRLRLQVDFLERHDDVVAVGGNAWHIDQHGHRTGYVTDFSGDAVGDPGFIPSVEPYLMHPFLTVRRSALVAVGGYRYLFHAEDTDLYWRLMGRGILHNLPDVLGEYRVHPGSVSSRSIINGRIAAIHSQLASLSEMRRRDGREDLHFEKKKLAEMEGAESLTGMLAIAAKDLLPNEQDYLRIAVSAKLIELSAYRAYRLENADLSEIKKNLSRYLPRLSLVNRRQIVFRQIIVARLKLKRYREAWALMPIGVLPRSFFDLFSFMLVRKLRQLRPSKSRVNESQ